MRNFQAVIIAMVLVFSSAFAALGMNAAGMEPRPAPLFSGLGSGTVADPFQITNVNQLQEMNLALGANYTLMNDIDASATSSWNAGAGFVPVGAIANSFTGSLDGQYHTIAGLYIKRSGTSYVGLFGNIGGLASITNLGLMNCNITGSSFVGGFAGWNEGTINNCSSTGNASGTSTFVGGFAGRNEGTINNCSSTGNTSGTSNYVGGFTGANNVGTITNCYSTGNANGINYVGGFAGWNVGTITDCYSTGNASGITNVGGFTGWNTGGTTNNCSSTGNASGVSEVGGFAGWTIGTITDCYSTGSASGTSNYIGGFAGWNEGTINNCSSTGNASGITGVGGFAGRNLGTITDCYGTGKASGSGDVGGFAGYNSDGTIINCYSAGNASGTSKYVGGFTGRTIGTITDCYSAGNANGINYVGGFAGNNSGGTINNCYSTGNAGGTSNYVGGFAGWNVGTINNCYSTGNANGASNYVGGFAGWNVGTITNCYSTGNANGANIGVGGFIAENGGAITNCHSTGNASGITEVGGFTGRNSVTITNCYSSGNASGTSNYVGGFAGWNAGTINNCHTTGNASGITDVGAFAGWNSVTITNCYSSGNASGNTEVGGFTGRNVGTITNCYSTGNASGITDVGGFAGRNPGTITDCFWDKQTSGLIGSDGGTGLNTEEMQNQLTFINVGWGFHNIWAIKDGYTYPFFRWQYLNDAPMAMDDHIAANENSILVISAPGLLANDDDPDLHAWLSVGESIIIINYESISVLGSNITADANGGFTYDPTRIAEFQSLAVGEAIIDSFNYTISDDQNVTDTSTVYINVTGVNDPPLITNVPVTSTLEGAPYALALTATDIDASDLLIWSMVSGPAWLTLNVTTLRLEGTPGNADVGSSWVEVKATDLAGAIDSLAFMLTVGNTNDLPAISTLDDTIAIEDALYYVDYDATDPDVGDTLTWILSTNATWLNLDSGNGVLSGTPDNSHVGTYSVNITVDDGNGGLDWTNFTLTVVNTNDLPSITTVDDTTAVEGTLYSMDYNATDPDVGDILTWSLTTNATWLNLVATAGVLYGSAYVGIFYANISVSDGNGESDWSNFTLTVHSDEDGDGTPDYIDPDFLAYETIVNNTVWNNQTLSLPANNVTYWNNQTYYVPANETGTTPDAETIIVYETPTWTWIVVVAAIVLAIVSVLGFMRGGKPPIPEKEAEPSGNLDETSA